MTTTNSLSIQFLVRTNKMQTEGLIYARVTVNGQRSEISLKLSIEQRLWNRAKELSKGNTENAKYTNRCIEESRFRLRSIYHELIEQKKTNQFRNH